MNSNGLIEIVVLERRSRFRRVGSTDCPCGCAACRADALDEAPQRPRAARRQTSARAAGPQLPGWGGWSKPVSLKQIEQARAAHRRGEKVAPELLPFVKDGPQVYRITRAGIDRDRPLSIGMTKGNHSIGDRVHEHFAQPSRADKKVHDSIKNLQPGQILVQAGDLTRQGMHARRARNYEGWLQDRQRPLLYDPNSTTFDEAGLFRL